ncbi:Recoverin [Oopsacas minuta]|uniref:Recoverin n=1 Tax=Oopsacas minuta TaxID=111878 RepID=A0AAV7K8A5_9METZ|nr:Recoverin [Oopsacas minuta]
MGTRMSRVKIESDLLSQLSQKTQFTEEDLRSWNIAFVSECPSGRLSQREFASIFRKLFPLPVTTDKDTSTYMLRTQQTSVEELAFKSHVDLSQLLFRGFPTSPDNTTDFKGFATVLSIICRGHQNENTHDIATQRANTVYTALSKEQDDTLSSEDFMNWIKQNEEVIDHLDIFLNRL